MLRFILLPLLFCLSKVFAQQFTPLVIGTYTQTGSHGIYTANFDTASGRIVLLDSISASNPSYLCISPNGRNVYAVSETAADKPGSVLSFDYNSLTGKLKLLNAQSSGGDHPCFISIDALSKYVAVANYSGGTLALLPIDKMGTLKPPVQVIQRRGSGPDKRRQEKPHVHQAIFSPKQNHVVIADLGTDEIVGYKINTKKPLPLDTLKTKKIKVAPGAGPRHIAFHPSKPVFYVMEEMSGKVSVHIFGKKRIAWIQVIESDTISTQPGSADIHVSPDGRFLYASNRADANSVTIFSIGQNNGKLTRVGQQSTGGITPRNFVIHPSGNWLLVANQNSNNIVVFHRDNSTGLLNPTGEELKLPSPVCLAFGQ
ncbi:MAG: lactonase family protein [Chitinophagaceae bacterium]|jgi:6-phosphogluconolactonase|nr:lactonase family protein [Chitinophagaceae bacterium]